MASRTTANETWNSDDPKAWEEQKCPTCGKAGHAFKVLFHHFEDSILVQVQCACGKILLQFFMGD